MAGRTLMAAALTTVLLAAAAVAHAETAKPLDMPSVSTHDALAPDASQWGPLAGRRSLQWDTKTGHWGFKLDLDQQVGRPLSYSDRDIQAGAFYKITPSFRLGGTVSLGSTTQTPQALIPADKAPRVRLETSLKF
jgi:hypothetical protein